MTQSSKKVQKMPQYIEFIYTVESNSKCKVSKSD